VDRHSAEFEEKINVLEADDSSAFRIRSRTVGDLNDMNDDDDNIMCNPVSSVRGFHTGEPSICATLLDENVNGFPLACVSFAADPLALLLELRLEFDEHELFVS
jgi:hypothetical protein